MNKIYTIIAFLISYTVLFSEPANIKNQKVIISNFKPHYSKERQDISEKITEKFTQYLSSKGFTILSTDMPSIADSIQFSQKELAGYYVNGYYQKKDDSSNLNLYIQIYNPKNGYMIDAFNITDYNIDFEGIILDKEELKEPDDTRIEKAYTHLHIILRSNPDKKENWDNINEFAIHSGLDAIYHFPIRHESVSTEAESAAVFDILQNQMTVSSTKIAKRTSDAPTIVSVISQEDIVDYGRMSINDVMYQLPGFAPSQDFDRRTVSSRGMFESWDNSHYMFLVDGVQFNDHLYGSAYTWEITPTNMIKSLEIIRGPGSALYGSNSISGVININTFSGSDLKGGVETRIRAGSLGTRIYDIMTGNSTKYASYIVSYNSFQTDGFNYKGYDASGKTNILGLLDEVQKYDQRKNSYLFAKIEGEEYLKGLSVQYHRQNWDFQTLNGWLFQAPQQKESMSESRDIVSIKYSNKITEKLSQEYVARYQAHHINWNAQLLPITDSSNGVNEYLKSTSQDVLTRAQYTYLLNPDGASILAGMEHTHFIYKGDDAHYSNTNLSPYNNSSYPPEDWRLPYNVPYSPFRQGPWLDWIKDKPVKKYGFFSQLVSGKILHKTTEVTIGVRHDETLQHFRGIDKPYKNFPDMFPDLFTPETSDIVKAHQPNEQRTLKSTNPRIGFVFFVTPNLNLKAMAGTAFREPSVTNQFGAHTYMLAVENPRTLKPEKITTYEFGLDWFIHKNINWRANIYHTKFENQMAYASYGTSTYTNLYNLFTRGLETEVLYAIQKNISGFANFSYTHRINEKILDKGVSQNLHSVAWYPNKTANFGIKVNQNWFHFSLSLQYTGSVNRRMSDMGFTTAENEWKYPIILPDIEPRTTNKVYYRPQKVHSWYSVNTRLVYKLKEDFTIGFSIKNLFNSHQTLIKTYNMPFDYLREGRTIYFDMSLRL